MLELLAQDVPDLVIYLGPGVGLAILAYLGVRHVKRGKPPPPPPSDRGEKL
jgi:hypothetical protein